MTRPWGVPSKPFQRAMARWRRRQRDAERNAFECPAKPDFTIAISRERGAGGSVIAKEIGRRLDWTVFDRQLLERIAESTGARAELVESLDEKHTDWFTHCLEGLTPGASINDWTYFKHLRQVLCSLAAHGECVIVGRGAAFLLPPETTLRVLLVAPHKYRVARVCRECDLTEREATRHVDETDRAREKFVHDRLNKDPMNVHLYDLVLNTSQLSDGLCVDIIIATLQRLQSVGRNAGSDERNAGSMAMETPQAEHV